MRKINKIEPKLPVLPTRKKVAAYARVSVETERLHHSLSERPLVRHSWISWNHSSSVLLLGFVVFDSIINVLLLKNLGVCKDGCKREWK